DIGRYHIDLYAGALDQLVDLTECGALDGARVHHTHYRAFLADPLGTARDIAAATGSPFDAETEHAMQAYLDAHPQGALGEHRYSFDDLAVDRDAVRARFARYQSRFGVESEGGPEQ